MVTRRKTHVRQPNAVLLSISIGYSLGQLALGLVIHPYQTMQLVVQDKLFVWMTLFPSLLLAVVTAGWREVTVPFVQQFFSCSISGFWLCHYLEFVSNWITFYCIYWQVMLLYLFARFWWAWEK